MEDEASVRFQLSACRELMESHPESLRIREQVEALEEALPDKPGVVVSFCRTIIETTCKTVLTDRGIVYESAWEAPRLISETTKYLHLGQHDNGQADARLRDGAEKLVRGVNSIIDGVMTIRNDHGSAAHGADAYAPMLDARYAEIVARATDAVVGLIFKTHLQSANRDPITRFRYGDHKDFDDWVDSETDGIVVLDTPLVPSEALFRTDFGAYRAALVQFKQDQLAARKQLIELLRAHYV
jgi:hypothetical protein